MLEYLKNYYSEDNGCECGGDCHCEESADNIVDEDPMIEIVDPDSGEKFTFYFADEFEHEGNQYCVLVTDDEENPEYVIGRMVEEDGESFIETLGEEEDDEVYDAYEEILAGSFDNEEEDEED